jgi:hypothetical protein
LPFAHPKLIDAASMRRDVIDDRRGRTTQPAQRLAD